MLLLTSSNILVLLLYCYRIFFRLSKPPIKVGSVDCVALAMALQHCATGVSLDKDGCMSLYCMRNHDLMSRVQRANGTTSLSSEGEVHRELKGALVRFGPGAGVSSVGFSSDDNYEVRVSCEQQTGVAERLQDHLAELFGSVPNSYVTSTKGPDGPRVYIYVRFTDKNHAEALRAKLVSDPLRYLPPKSTVVTKDGLSEDFSTSCFSEICFQNNSVRCYWTRSSRDALLAFDTIHQAKEAEKFLRNPEIRIHGRRIHARYETVYRPLELPGVRIRYLDINVKHRTIIDKLPTNMRPIATRLLDPSYRTAFAHVEHALMKLLRRYGPIESCQVTEKCNHRDSRAIVQFRSPKDAQTAARDLEGYRMPEIGDSQLKMRRNVSLQFRKIPGSVFNLLLEGVDQLQHDLHHDGQVRMEVEYETCRCKRESVNIQLSGRHVTSVAKAKTAIQNLLAGELAMWDSSKLWDDWFAELDKSTHFVDLGTDGNGIIRVDFDTEQLFLYGSAPAKESLRKAILATLAMHKEQAANNAMYASHESNARVYEEKHGKLDCSICLTPASDPIQTTCGHTYCKSCFAHQCSSATSNGMIPIRCVGDSDKCSHIFTVEELRTFLTHESFEQLLETSLVQYVRSNAKSLRHCPTPDCPSLYRLTTRRGKLLCHTCLNIICISCQVQDHFGKSCSAYQAAVKAEETFTKWKEENNVNECPRCDAPIEKTDGCNHIECTNCSNHICWQCLASFPTGPEVYKHMDEEHGTFMPAGEGWQEDDVGDDGGNVEHEDDADDEAEDAPFDQNLFDFDIPIQGVDPEMVIARPNRQLPPLDYLLIPQEQDQEQGQEQEHENQQIPAPAAPQPPIPHPHIPHDNPPFLPAHMDANHQHIENIAPPVPAPQHHHRRRRLGNAALNWLMGILRNNAPRPPHRNRGQNQNQNHAQPAPEPDALALPPHITEGEGRFIDSDDDTDSDSDSDSDDDDDMETASQRSSHPSQDGDDNDENIYTNETPPPRLVDEDDATSTEAEEELEMASEFDSDSESNPDDNRHMRMRGGYGDDDDADDDDDSDDENILAIDPPSRMHELVWQELDRLESLGVGFLQENRRVVRWD